MTVITVLIIASFSMALIFLGAFLWAVKSDQFEDTTTPSMRVILEDINEEKNSQTN